MPDRLLSGLPYNSNPADSDHIISTSSASGDSLQYSLLSDVVKARYNPASGWVLKDGTVSPYQASAGDKILVNTSTTGFELVLPASPSFGDEITIFSKGNDFDVNLNGENIESTNLSTTPSYVNHNVVTTFVYQDATTGWISLFDNPLFVQSTFANAQIADNPYFLHLYNNNANDISGNDRNGSLGGAYQFVKGYPGFLNDKALQVTAGWMNITLPTINTFTLEALIRCDAPPGSGGLYWLDSNSPRSIWTYNSNALGFGTFDGGWDTFSGSNSFQDGSWHHCVITQNGTTASLYIDGSLVDTNPHAYGIASNHVFFDNYLRQGDQSPLVPYSHHAFYNYVLSGTQIANHYNAL